MGNIILTNLPVKVDIEYLTKILHIDEDDAQRFEELVSEALSIAKPRAVYRISYIDKKGDDYVIADGIKLVSRVLSVNMESTHRIFPFVATCGMELEDWSNSISDMMERYWADNIKEAVLYSAAEGLNAHIGGNIPGGAISRMNPGSLQDWPMSEQFGVFRLLGDVQGEIGVSLTDSYLMIPVKSVSGIAFPTESSFESCQLCPRDNCPGRRAPYDNELYDRKYK